MSVAAIIDVMSIQKYIYASNKLKENLGASYIVSRIFKDFGSGDENFKRAFDKAYEGGGNALLIFDDAESAAESLKNFSLYVIDNYPGLDISIGLNHDFKDDPESISKLYLDLKKTKNSFIPITNIPSHGFTAECPRTGLSAEAFYKDDSGNNSSYISASSYIKIRKADRSKEEFNNILKEIELDQNYTFTNQLEKLGQDKFKDSHIALVFIDGNSMSDRFMAQKSIKNKQELSLSVSNAVRESFKDLIIKIDREIENINGEVALWKDENKTILPIRPIVLGGDDFSFVSDGRLGVYFAKVFMEKLEKKVIFDGSSITSCAGVCVVHSKYPFYRAHTLAEELCENAKDVARIKYNSSTSSLQNESYIDFYLSYGGLSGSLEDIREHHYSIAGKKLYSRPYTLKELDKIFPVLKQLKKIPESKIKELREVLNKSAGEQLNFMNHMTMRGHQIPLRILEADYNESESKKGFFIDGKTHFLDLIELLEILPAYIYN